MENLYQNFDVISVIGRHINELTIEYNYQNFDIISAIGKHVSELKPLLPSMALISLSDYSAQVLLKGNFTDTTRDILPIFLTKSSKDIMKWGQSQLKPYNVLGLDMNLDTHFWFQIYPNIIKNNMFKKRVRDRPLNNVRQAILISSIWDGIGSALVPTLSSELKELNISTVALTILPSKVQPSDVQFNAFSSLGLSISTSFTPLLLIERDNLENYIGIDRKGIKIKGNELVNYLLELFATETKFVEELNELSRAFDTRIFTIFLTTGASIGIYGSLENMLDTSRLSPLLTCDFSTGSIFYILIRIPSHLKTKLPREIIEFQITNWVKQKTSLKSINFSEPIYTEDANDRIDIVILAGGINLTENISLMEKKFVTIKNNAINRGSLKEKEWETIAKSLAQT